jgi:hypothetical protein
VELGHDGAVASDDDAGLGHGREADATDGLDGQQLAAAGCGDSQDCEQRAAPLPVGTVAEAAPGAGTEQAHPVAFGT